MLAAGSMNNIGDVFVSVRNASADDEITQNALGLVEIAFGSEE